MKKFNKLFGIGAQKTATSSLAAALNELSIKTSHWTHHEQVFRDIQRGNFKFKLLDTYDAIVDNPIPAVYKELDQAYPSSKFILTVREPKSWLKSVIGHLKREESDRLGPETALFYKTDRYDAEIFMKAYISHNKEVIEYFKDRPEDLLVINICGGDGWEKLCPFLGLPMPQKEFPNLNKNLSRTKARLYKKIGKIGMFLHENYPKLYLFMKKLI